MNSQLYIVTGASGAGKTSIVDALVRGGIGKRVITCTTRAPRVNNGVMEVDGIDYRFLSMDDFNARLTRDEFAEHANVYGRLYGTLKADVEEACRGGIAFAIVDVQGAETLLRVYPGAWSIYVNVSKEDLKARLQLRGERQESIEKRLAEYDNEAAKMLLFHSVIENDNDALDNAIKVMRFIVAK